MSSLENDIFILGTSLQVSSMEFRKFKNLPGIKNFI